MVKLWVLIYVELLMTTLNLMDVELVLMMLKFMVLKLSNIALLFIKFHEDAIKFQCLFEWMTLSKFRFHLSDGVVKILCSLEWWCHQLSVLSPLNDAIKFPCSFESSMMSHISIHFIQAYYQHLVFHLMKFNWIVVAICGKT